jgi:hypothetical protein
MAASTWSRSSPATEAPFVTRCGATAPISRA